MIFGVAIILAAALGVLLTLKIRHLMSPEMADLPSDLANEISGETVDFNGDSYIAIRVRDARGRILKFKVDPRQAIEVSHNFLRWGARSLPTSDT